MPSPSAPRWSFWCLKRGDTRRLAGCRSGCWACHWRHGLACAWQPCGITRRTRPRHPAAAPHRVQGRLRQPRPGAAAGSPHTAAGPAPHDVGHPLGRRPCASFRGLNRITPEHPCRSFRRTAWPPSLPPASLQWGAPAPRTATPMDDPHLWLEEVEGEEALDWVRARNAETEAELAATPQFRQLEADLRAILDSDAKIPGVQKIGDYYYNFWKDAQHERGLWRR